ncbi:mechanosensitive ion channel family protein [Amaricoccus sp. W119]|uniref:mechanosensitive ion channel family protein n=1 Tax=Amaricoccus sp. W119 TaxID=3391833 RepID=UPI0039A65B73
MESYQRLVDVIALQNLRMRLEFWLLTEVLVWSTLGQVAAIAVCLVAAHVAAVPLRARLAGFIDRRGNGTPTLRALLVSAHSIIRSVVAFAFLAMANAVAARFGWPNLLLSTATNLIGAWIVIRLLAGLIRNDFWARVVALLAFGVATLNILGLLGPAIVWLDQLDFRLGDTSVSALDLLRAAFELAVLLWLAVVVARLLETRVTRAPNLTPSLRVLTAKLIRFSLIGLALVVALTSTGIDLTAFALFTGALGVGIGFGLQKPISNIISGLILLFDRSIKPGDVIELTDPGDHQKLLFGWVTALNARYVSLTTRDGTEWLVPNEDLISRRVINWSYSHNRLRLLTPISVSFDSDVPLAMRLIEEAALETRRVMKHPQPVCRLMSFGDSTVNLEMRFWIDDPANGVINVRSAVLLAIWEKFRANGIRTPLAHRDLLIKPTSELRVRFERERPEGARSEGEGPGRPEDEVAERPGGEQPGMA